MSKDSAFFANARKKDVKTDQRIAACRAKLKSFYQPSGMDRYAQAQRRGGPPSTTAPPTTADTAAARRAQTKAEMLCQTIEESRDLSRTWVCVDMDMFFAAVAMRDDPSLRDIPMAIGGIGMISTANYKAREYGVRSAMPGFIAKQLCPHLKFVRADSTAIKEAAMQARRVFAEYDPNFSSMSMDEAKLDITKYLKRTTDGGGDSGSDDDSDDGDDERKDLPTRGLKSAELHWADRAGVIEHAGQMPVLEGIEAECAKINALLAGKAHEFDGLVSTAWVASVVTSKALRASNNEDLKFIAIDHDQIVLDAIKDGVIQGTMLQNPHGQAYIATYALDKLLNGCSIKADAPFSPTPQHTTFIDSGTMLVTKDNIGNWQAEMKAVTDEIMATFDEKFLDCAS